MAGFSGLDEMDDERAASEWRVMVKRKGMM